MNCSVCGNTLNASARFCSGCGRLVDERAFQREQRRLTRPLAGRTIAGVCAGFADYFGWDVTIVRLVLVLSVIFGCGTPLLAYLIAWIVMPSSPVMVPMAPDAPHSGAQPTT